MSPLSTLVLPLILLFTTLTTAIRLSDLQGIISFPQACTDAYSRDIPDCTLSEFSLTGVASTTSGQGICSVQCVRALSAATNFLNFQCGTTRGRPGTLIALFFNNQGVGYLCPNSQPGFNPQPVSTSATAAASASASETSQAADSSSTAAASTTTATSAATSTTTTATPKDSKTSAAFATYTAIDKGVTEVITSESQRANSQNADAFGGGGSPFEVAANAASAQIVGTSGFLGMWVAGMLVLGFGLGWV